MPVVELRLTAKPAMADALPVARALPRRERRFVGPFCFLDHFGPHEDVGRADGGVAPHPHIGLATVTYLFDGAILHHDSLGTAQRIVPGDVNWMTAGRGIVHSERTPADRVGVASTSHGLQIWVALPLAHEDDPPSFQHAPAASLPAIELPGARLRVLLGAWAGVAVALLAAPCGYAALRFDEALAGVRETLRVVRLRAVEGTLTQALVARRRALADEIAAALEETRRG